MVPNTRFPGPLGMKDFPPPLDDAIARRHASDGRGQARLYGLHARGTRAQAASAGEARARVGARLREALMVCEAKARESEGEELALRAQLDALRRRNDALQRELDRRTLRASGAAQRREQEQEKAAAAAAAAATR